MESTGNRPRPVETFMADHRAVWGKLDTLDQTFSRLQADISFLQEADTAFFREMMTLFDTELVVHFEREEKALFPAIERYVPGDMGPVGIMLEEHVKVFDTIDRFRKGVQSVAGPDETTKETIEELMFDGRSIIELLRSHIEKEDNVLLPMAESHLSDSEWEQVWVAMEEITLETVE